MVVVATIAHHLAPGCSAAQGRSMLVGDSNVSRPWQCGNGMGCAPSGSCGAVVRNFAFKKNRGCLVAGVGAAGVHASINFEKNTQFCDTTVPLFIIRQCVLCLYLRRCLTAS